MTMARPPRTDTRSAREIARGQTRRAGDRSAKLARDLMKLAPPALRKLEVDDDLREAIDRARAVTSPIARRRAERSLAGDLRRYDLVALAEQLATLHETSSAEIQQLHLAEHWRARLIEEGMAALAELAVAGDDPAWPRLIDAAQREKATGRPPGAARALFRHIIDALKAEQRAGEDDLEDDEDAE